MSVLYQTHASTSSSMPHEPFLCFFCRLLLHLPVHSPLVKAGQQGTYLRKGILLKILVTKGRSYKDMSAASSASPSLLSPELISSSRHFLMPLSSSVPGMRWKKIHDIYFIRKSIRNKIQFFFDNFFRKRKSG